MKAWLKGGLWGAGIITVIFLLNLFSDVIIHGGSPFKGEWSMQYYFIASLPALAIIYPILISVQKIFGIEMHSVILGVIFVVIVYTLIGALVGLIIGKIKNRNAEAGE